MKIETLLIEKIYISDQSKDGRKFTTKAGKPYKRIAIKTREYPQDYLTNFIFTPDDVQLIWKAGDIIKVIVSKNNQYLNYRLPARVDYLEKRIEELEKVVFNKEMGYLPSKAETEEDEINKKLAEEEENLPF